jgi:GNAT superfamily N-acetyltransferase
MKATIWHLEMTDAGQLRPPSRPVAGLALREIAPPDPELNRRFYVTVGARFQWTDRLPWSAEQWRAWATDPDVTTVVAEVAGVEAGYAEIHRQDRGDVELAFFGLLPGHIGRGIGSAFLYEVVRRAWSLGAKRVWLHTCSLDHPTALPGYLARGFQRFKTVEADVSDAMIPRRQGGREGP